MNPSFRCLFTSVFITQEYQREFVKAIVFLLWFYDLTIKTGLITWLSYSHGSKDQLATPMGFEPTTSSVTGWHSDHLNYGAIYKKGIGAPTLHKVFVFP